ncbi:putative cyclin 9,cyclin C-like [Trypanosoma cruzi]|uniref:Putative cyclin 9,cyclin C-like n=1 Tax=Trypanosoma cruzi TaxID=5693 RepID=A0A2V2WU93_TRYCR|nr:putative cyclin 9,cyclin C-like [Trypanosoma cruzi]
MDVVSTPLWSSPPCGSPMAGTVSSGNPLFHVGRSYYRSAAKAYNMTRYVVETLKLDETVLATSMAYWHTFVDRLELRKFDEIVLSASCAFLASKVEHYKVRLNRVIALVFEISGEGDEMEGWRRMLLEMELLVCHTLGFNFQIIHPMKRIVELVPEDHTQVLECAHRLFLLSFMTPLCVRVPADEVAEALVYLAADGAGQLEPYAGKFRCDAVERREGIINVMIDALAVMRKNTSLPKVDDMIVARRKRMREQESFRPSVAHSSGGTGSLDVTPSAFLVE